MADKKSKSQKKAAPQKKAASSQKPKMSRAKMEKVAGAAAILAALGLGAYGASKTEKGKAAIQKAKDKKKSASMYLAKKIIGGKFPEKKQ